MDVSAAKTRAVRRDLNEGKCPCVWPPQTPATRPTGRQDPHPIGSRTRSHGVHAPDRRYHAAEVAPPIATSDHHRRERPIHQRSGSAGSRVCRRLVGSALSVQARTSPVTASVPRFMLRLRDSLARDDGPAGCVHGRLQGSNSRQSHHDCRCRHHPRSLRDQDHVHDHLTLESMKSPPARTASTPRTTGQRSVEIRPNCKVLGGLRHGRLLRESVGWHSSRKRRRRQPRTGEASPEHIPGF